MDSAGVKAGYFSAPCGARRISSAPGFTLLELLTVVIILAILAAMLIPVVQGVQGKAARLACTGNLKSLYVAANSYTIDNQKWPQVTASVHSDAYSDAWYNALAPYYISRVNWRCPTVEKKLGRPGRDPKDKRIDYFASPFPPEPRAPYKWTTQPWFIERSDSHGNGNLMIFSRGDVHALGDVVKKRK